MVDALLDLDIGGTFTVGTAATGVSISSGSIDLKNSGAVSNIKFYCESSNAHYVELKSPDHSSYSGNVNFTLPPTNGTAGTFLTSDGSGNTSWAAAGGAYTDWAIKTGTYTAVAKDQLIANSASAFTITLPASPSGGDTVIIANAGAGLVTVGRNSSNINSAAEDGTLPQGNSVQLVYVDATIGWFEI